MKINKFLSLMFMSFVFIGWLSPLEATMSWSRYNHSEDNTNSSPLGPNKEKISELQFDPLLTQATGLSVTGQIVASGNLIYNTSWDGKVTARNFKTGEIVWERQFPDVIRNTPLIVDNDIYFTEYNTSILHKLNRMTGASIWSVKLEIHQDNTASGSPAFAMSKGEPIIIHGLDSVQNTEYLRDVLGACTLTRPDDYGSPVPICFDPLYPNPNIPGNELLGVALPAYSDNPNLSIGQKKYTVTGEVVFVNADSGSIIRRTSTADGPNEFGIGVWSTPAVDQAAGEIFIGTAQSYNGPASRNACAILALSIDDGTILRRMSFNPNDGQAVESCVWSAQYPAGYSTSNPPNPLTDALTPGNIGGDIDVGSSPVLYSAKVNGEQKKLVAAMNKSGRIRVFDRETGTLISESRPTKGSIIGNTGVAYHDGVLYVASAQDDVVIQRFLLDSTNFYNNNAAFGAIFSAVFQIQITIMAYDAVTLNPLWSSPDITYGHTVAALSYSKGLLYHVNMKGEIRVLDAENGALVSQYSTFPFEVFPGFQLPAPIGNSVSFHRDAVLVPVGFGLGADGGIMKLDLK